MEFTVETKNVMIRPTGSRAQLRVIGWQSYLMEFGGDDLKFDAVVANPATDSLNSGGLKVISSFTVTSVA